MVHELNIGLEDLTFLPIGVLLIGDLNKYNEVLFNKTKYRNVLLRNIMALMKIFKKISLFVSFGEPFVLENFEFNNKITTAKQREIISILLMEKIKNEIKKIWNVYKIEEKFNINLNEYFGGV